MSNNIVSANENSCDGFNKDLSLNNFGFWWFGEGLLIVRITRIIQKFMILTTHIQFKVLILCLTYQWQWNSRLRRKPWILLKDKVCLSKTFKVCFWHWGNLPKFFQQVGLISLMNPKRNAWCLSRMVPTFPGTSAREELWNDALSLTTFNTLCIYYFTISKIILFKSS